MTGFPFYTEPNQTFSQVPGLVCCNKFYCTGTSNFRIRLKGCREISVVSETGTPHSQVQDAARALQPGTQIHGYTVDKV